MSRLFWVWKFGGFGGCVQTLKTIVTQHGILTAVWLGADSALCMQLLSACWNDSRDVDSGMQLLRACGMIPGVCMQSGQRTLHAAAQSVWNDSRDVDSGMQLFRARWNDSRDVNAVWAAYFACSCSELAGMIPGMLTVACSCSERVGMFPGMLTVACSCSELAGMIPGMSTVACSCSELAGMIPGMLMRSARMDADSSS